MEADGFKCHQCGCRVDAIALKCPDCGAALAAVRETLRTQTPSLSSRDGTDWKARLLRGAGKLRTRDVTIRTQTTTRRAYIGDNGPEAAARICPNCGAAAQDASVSLCEHCHAPLTTHLDQPLSVDDAHRTSVSADLEAAVSAVELQVPESLKASVVDAHELMVQPCPKCGSRGTWKLTRTVMKPEHLRGTRADPSTQASLICTTCGHAMPIP